MLRIPLKLGVVPFMEVLLEPHDLKVLHFNDFEGNATFNQAFFSIAMECGMICKRNPCQFDITFTEGKDFKSSENSFVLTPLTPKGRPIKIITIPVTTWIDFLLNLSNCVGIWFGLSVWSLNPIKLFPLLNEI